MKRLTLALIVVIAIFGVWSCAPTTEPAGSSTTPAISAPAATPASASTQNTEAEITQLERDWAAAIVNRDAATVNRLLADDFNGTSSTALTFPKDVAIEDLTSGLYMVKSMNLDEISVNVYGDAAVAFTSQEEKSKYAGKDTSGHYHFTNVWIKKDGRWQVVASHGTRYGSPHKKT